jgi:hypothetical protein
VSDFHHADTETFEQGFCECGWQGPLRRIVTDAMQDVQDHFVGVQTRERMQALAEKDDERRAAATPAKDRPGPARRHRVTARVWPETYLRDHPETPAPTTRVDTLPPVPPLSPEVEHAARRVVAGRSTDPGDALLLLDALGLLDGAR